MSPDTIDAMLAAGATAEVIAAAWKAEIAARERAIEEKRAKDAERQRRHRESRDVTVTECDTADPSPLKVSPQTPLPKTPNQNAPLSPPKSGKRLIPADWTPPPVSELPPRARALAEQWTDASYQTQGEGFLLYWRNQRKMRPDWDGTWANWVIRVHSQVMRDQKFGNAPPDVRKASTPAEQLETLRRWLPHYEEAGRTADVEACKVRIAALEAEITPATEPAMAAQVGGILRGAVRSMEARR